jgi:hypothetical protein
MAGYTEHHMDDWQGCLSPQCQSVLVNARDSVNRRGGAVITVEDFLLSLLDSCPPVARFLRERGVDIDELVRTIQCEQPIVTGVGGEGLLSSQLIYWFASARQLCEFPWLDWPTLLDVLSHKTERLQEKAYVAVLEQVSAWPGAVDESEVVDDSTNANAPVVITGSDWHEMCDDVSVALSATATALIWVRGERGTGKTSWLHGLLSCLELGFVQVDLRREADVLANDLLVIPENADQHWPVLILDNTPPADLLLLMSSAHSLARALVTGWRGPVLLIGPGGCADDARCLERLLGRTLNTFDMPSSDATQRKAVLVAHQSAIEKRWNIELPLSVINYAATRRSVCVSSPGGMLEWVERAAARLSLFARRGPAEARALAGQCDTLRRQSLVALARDEPMEEIDRALERLQVMKTAEEITWHERKAAGTLRCLSTGDLRRELERWVAGDPGPVHYVVHCDNRPGDSASAGSGNIYS